MIKSKRNPSSVSLIGCTLGACMLLGSNMATAEIVAEYTFTGGSTASTGSLGSNIGFEAGITGSDTSFADLRINGLQTTGAGKNFVGAVYADIEGDRIATNNWVTFSITVPDTQVIDLTSLNFDYTEIESASFLLGVYTSKTGFLAGNNLLGLYRAGTLGGTFTDNNGISLALSGVAALQGLTDETVEFRFLLGDDSGATSRIHVLDNLVLSGAVASRPEGLTIRSQGLDLFSFAWPSEPGKFYDLLSNTDLAGPPLEWPIYDDGESFYSKIPSQGMTTRLDGVAAPDPRRFFIVETSPPEPSSFGLESESFQFTSGWTMEARKDSSGGFVLSSGAGASTPASTSIDVPVAGRYSLWVRSTDFPDNRPGERNFQVSVDGQLDSTLFGTSGLSGWTWAQGSSFDLDAGPVLISVYDNDGVHFARVDAVILTPDTTFTPQGSLAETTVSTVEVLDIDAHVEPVPVSGVTNIDTGAVAAQLANEHLEVAFVSAQRAGVSTVVPMMRVQGSSGWEELPLTASAESYQVLTGVSNTQVVGTAGKYHIEWSRQVDPTTTIIVNGVTAEVGGSWQISKNVVWDAGFGEEFIPSAARQDGANRIELDFHRGDSGVFTAVWELLPGEHSARISMNFVPDANGQYSLGYFPPFEKGLNEVNELLMPPIVYRKRFPSDSFTVVSGSTPTPVSLMQVAGANGPLSLGVIAAAEMIPQGFPKPVDSHFGLHIRNPRGLVQPSIYGPLIGTSGSTTMAGNPVSMSLHLLAEPGDWYAGYRVAADEVFGWRDYRQNGTVSGTDAALNMIDLYKDDEFGGWWDIGKGFYQIEGHNIVTHAAPLLGPSLYRLTSDQTLYERRTRPTLEYMLSRNNVHFSPIREGARNDMLGSMAGPVGRYGTTVNGAFDELLEGRMPFFRKRALPDSGQPTSVNFHEWLGHYMLTGDPASLQEAVDAADGYISGAIDTPPTAVLPIRGFFLLQYTPSWEGLLLIYEATGEKRFLDAAVFGARQVMTGMWTQRMPSEDGLITIHPNGQIEGDKMRLTLHKGSDSFRLGFPIQDGDIVEKQVPEWLVSPVGLGLEQPSTYSYQNQGGRLILQNNWAPGFLRLAHHTGDEQFATYARNASVGRSGNYPGYYYTTYSDLQQDPNYPYVGPDVGFIYYHHLPVHLTWSIDYLVSDAFYLSGGAVKFPGLRQFNYAYFDNLVYGHAPGEVFGHSDAWLWFRRGLVELDNPQINYLTAHDGSSFHVILTNQSREEQTVEVQFNPAEISPIQGDFATAVVTNGGDRPITMVNEVATVTLPPRGIVALRVDGLDIDVPTHRTPAAPGTWAAPDYLTINPAGAPEFRAASVQAKPGPWDAFIWCTALPSGLQDFSVVWTAGSESGTTAVDSVYPFEVTIPVEDGIHSMGFHIEGTLPGGSSFTSETHSIGVAP